jgi:hypothetical protein
MLNIFAQAEVNLGRAGWALVVTFLGSAAASFALGSVGFNPDLGLVVFLVGLPAIAWFMSQAARAQGRSPVLYALAGLVPPISLLAFIKLYTRDQDVRLARKYGAG